MIAGVSLCFWVLLSVHPLSLSEFFCLSAMQGHGLSRYTHLSKRSLLRYLLDEESEA